MSSTGLRAFRGGAASLCFWAVSRVSGSAGSFVDALLLSVGVSSPPVDVDSPVALAFVVFAFEGRVKTISASLSDILELSRRAVVAGNTR